MELALSARSLSRVHLIVSEAALRVARQELSEGISSARAWVASLAASRKSVSRVLVHDNADVGASIASGSYSTAGMIVIPCSAGSLGAIANGISRDLLGRAADVMLKERGPLVLTLRAAPCSFALYE